MNKGYYIIGMPSSGKTTFLAALGHLLDIGTDMNWRLIHCNNREYLMEVSARWASCKQMEHTPLNTQGVMELILADKGGNEYYIKLIDRAGEFFKRRKRSPERDYEIQDGIRGNTVLFFLNFANLKREPLEGVLPEELRENGLSEGAKEYKEIYKKMIRDFDLSVQADHVALLQTILDSKEKQINISLVVSAWDIFEGGGKLPENVIKDRAPLFWQMLQSHLDVLDLTYWGLSAQGGDWSEKTEREKIMDTDILQRTKLVNDKGEASSDITLLLS